MIPPFLIALRGDPGLYREAITIYYRLQRWVLDFRSFVPFTQLGPLALSSIRTLEIKMQYVLSTTNALLCLLRPHSDPRTID
jgi:hypothetical protein